MRWLDGITDFEQDPGVGDGQGSLECCSPWGHKELDTTEQMNTNNVRFLLLSTKLSEVSALALYLIDL